MSAFASDRTDRRGMAMVAVLLVLMALFVLCAPFLLTVRNADRASAQVADRATARLALDSAARHARARLAASHAGIDVTPTFDALDELEVSNVFDTGFFDANDPNGVMWDLDVEDEAGRIDLNSASPHVLANLLDGVARLSAEATDDDTEFQVGSTAGFPPAGILWIGTGGDLELVSYAGIEGNRFTGLVRGLGAQTNDEGVGLPCAPSAGSAKALGTYAIDQRMFAFARWRIATSTENDLGVLSLGAFDSIAQTAEVAAFAMTGELGEDFHDVLTRTTTVHGGVGAGSRWQRGSRLADDVRGMPLPGCVLPIDDPRSYNAGTTVMITDGRRVEYGIVRSSNRQSIRLMEPLTDRYEPMKLVVRPLARRPVNVNTAKPEVLRALVLNLKLRTSSSRITSGEANDLVEAIVQSRPFTGLEDFLRRLVLPAAGLDELPGDAPVRPDIFEQVSSLGERGEDGERELVGFIDDDDARALYKNALNANDNELEFSTMPFAFTTRDVYRMELRASVNAASGVERARGVREEIDLVVPQQDLLTVWSRQEDFDEEPRFHHDAPGWMSGPNSTHRHDRIFESRWPSRARAHLGPYDSFEQIDPPPDPDAVPELVFPDREGAAWIQLAPAREDEMGQRNRRVVHFDDETRRLEGRYLPDGAPVLFVDQRPVSWAPTGGMARALSLSMWIQPRQVQDGDLFLDLRGADDADRISLGVEQGELVLRVLDGGGDHPDSVFEERAEIRYALDGSEGGGGIPADVWTHLSIGVAGNRPDQMRMLVDGRVAPDRLGITRLTAKISEDARTIPVESTDGFPDRCVLRIGDELIEATKTGGTAFEASYDSVGENAGFGGRLARERFEGIAPNEINAGVATKQTDHEAGATVQLYGYSLPVYQTINASSGQLRGSLGPWAVGRVTGTVEGGGREREQEQMEPILIDGPNGEAVTAGWGMVGNQSQVQSLRLAPADPGQDVSEMMNAFSPDGGYAALLGLRRTFTVVGVDGATQDSNADQTGTRIGGIEVIAYSGWSGNQLHIARRGNNVGELANLQGLDPEEGIAGAAAHIFHMSPLVEGEFHTVTSEQVLVVPISVPYGGSNAAFQATAGASEFVQLTHVGLDSQRTEWVRFDENVGGHLVRDDPTALVLANTAAHAGLVDAPIATLQRIPEAPGGTPIDPTLPGRRGLFIAPPEPPPAPQGSTARFWDYHIGEPATPPENLPVTLAIASHLQFRGVLGTYSHDHPQGTLILPVFRLYDDDMTTGWPGRFDHVMFYSDLGNIEEDPAFPGVVMHAHRPFTHTRWSYVDAGSLEAEVDASEEVPHEGFDWTKIHCAIETSVPVPVIAQANPALGAVDPRSLSRMTLFPSGERPRVTREVAIGGAPQGGNVPSAVIDELVFGTDLMNHQLVVAQNFGDAAEDLVVRDVARTPSGDRPASGAAMGAMPEDAGLLLIGEEILCYDALDPTGQTLHVSAGARGLLGTDPQAHVPGTGITWLEDWRVSVLGTGIGPTDAQIPIVSSQDFPPAGTLLIDDELVHYTHLVDGIPSMPRASEVPGEMDAKGAGLFRGRYGTLAVDHPAGTPVILFPFRYWDRWTPRADAPELSYFGFAIDQPDAYWKRMFWADDQAPAAGPRLGVLQRTDTAVPWDEDPDRVRALDLFEDGRLQRDGNAIGAQSDRIEWRVFVDYAAGSFDPNLGTAHGWKTTPRLTMFGAEFMGPGRTLWRIER